MTNDAPVEGVDQGSNGDKDSDDKDNPGEEDARDAVEKQDEVWMEEDKILHMQSTRQSRNTRPMSVPDKLDIKDVKDMKI